MGTQYAITNNFIEILVFSVLHAIAIAAPMFAAASIAIRRGINDPMIVLGVAACFSGLYSYFIFWMWLLDPNIGQLTGIIGLLVTIAISLRFAISISTNGAASLKEWKNTIIIWFFFSLFILSAGLAPGDISHVLTSAAERFSHPLPIDNQLPFIFAQQVAEGSVQSPMVAGWLSSDRPPLQTAYFLASGAVNLERSDIHYQINGTLLQCLWIIALFALLRSRNIERKTVAIVVAVSIFSGTSIVHGLFVWPKLFPVFFLIITLDIALRSNTFESKKWLPAAICGTSAAFSMLCHGGSIFALIGLAAALLALKKTPSASFITITACAFIVLFATWAGYQKFFDPPGDRLLKWHLAGVIPVDGRTFLQALIDSYGKLNPTQILDLKISNFQVMLGNPKSWILNMTKSSFWVGSINTRLNIRAEQFFGIFPSFGLLSLAPVVLFFKQNPKNKQETVLGLQLLCITFFTIIFWALLLFGPSYTLVHAGSLATVLFFYFGSTLLAASRSISFAAILATLHIASTIFIYFSSGWRNSDNSIDIILACIATTSIAIVVVHLIKESRRFEIQPNTQN